MTAERYRAAGSGCTLGSMDIPARMDRLEQGLIDARLESRDEYRKIDIRLAKIETLLPTFATKTDLQETKSDIIRWIMGTAIALAATAITVITFVLNNAAPRQAAPQAPVIIQLPPLTTVTPTPAAQPATAKPGRD